MKLKKRQILRTIISFVLVLTVFCSFSSAFMCVFADGDAITVYIDNEQVKFKNAFLKEGDIVYVPFEELFFKLGVYMEWDKETKLYTGTGNNGLIEIPMDSMTATVDSVELELPAPAKKINGVAMIPLYLIEDALKTEPAVYDSETNSVYIKSSTSKINAAKEVDPAAMDYEKLEARLPEGVDLFNEQWLYDATSYLTNDQSKNEYINYKVVDVEGMHFDKAASFETLPYKDGSIPAQIYDIQYSILVDTGDFKAEDCGLMTLWARATKITDESGYAYMRPCYERLGDYHKIGYEVIEIGPEWKKYYIPLHNGTYTAFAGNAHFTYSVGAKPQTIEVADVHIMNYGTSITPEELMPYSINSDDYHGIEEDALWRKEAYRRIEKYRKNDMIIEVTDENGNPIEGAEVSADMTENEFMWGCCATPWEIYDLDPESKVGRIRSEVIDECFNTFFDAQGTKENIDDYINTIRSTNEIIKRGKRMRGHAYTWDDVVKLKQMPNYETATYEEIYDYLMKEVIEEAWLFRGKFNHWDTLNEPQGSRNVRTRFGTQMFSDAFKIAKALDPTCKLYLNETGMGNATRRDQETNAQKNIPMIINMIENERAPIDGLGLQGHGQTYNYPQYFYRDLDILAGMVDEISVTEYDFTSKDNRGRASEHLRDRVIATFSHPKATSFIIWGYASRTHWVNTGALYDMDWEKTPEYSEWMRLTTEEFMTHEKKVTDKDGRAMIRGFRGDYDISVAVTDKDGKVISDKCEFTLAKAENAERDNKIKVVFDGKEFKFAHSNVPKYYPDGLIKYRTGNEAYADYIATYGDRTPIGIYKHKNDVGATVPETTDGSLNSFWYGDGDGAYVQYELVEMADRGDVTVTFRTPCGEIYDYKIFKSKDGESWTEIFSGNSAEKKTVDFEDAMFVKIVSVNNEYMGISEVSINAEKD